MDVADAIDATPSKALTASSWKTAKEDQKGYYADLVLLDRDIFTVDPMEIKDILPEMTMVGGKVVYQK